MTTKLTTKGGIKRLKLTKREFQNLSLYVMISRPVQPVLRSFQNCPFERILIHESFNLPFITYRESPTQVVFTTVNPTTAIFSLCTCKWGIFAVVGDCSTVPLTQISCNTVFSKSQKAPKARTLCIRNWKDFCLKINIPKRNHRILRICVMGRCQKYRKLTFKVNFLFRKSSESFSIEEC